MAAPGRAAVALIVASALSCTQTRNVRVPIRDEAVRACVAACEGTFERFECLSSCPGHKMIADGGCVREASPEEACAQRKELKVLKTAAVVAGSVLGVVVLAYGVLFLAFATTTTH